MSEFDKLMKGGRQRKEVKQRQGDRRQIRVMLLWSFCIAIVLSFMPPHLGILLFIPALVIAFSIPFANGYADQALNYFWLSNMHKIMEN